METATKKELSFVPSLELSRVPAKKVENYAQIKDDAKLLLDFVDKEHSGQYSQAYAVSHCQVSKEPYAFFVLNSQFVKKDVPDKLKFPHRIIINPEIVECVENFMMPVGQEKELPTIDLGEGAECEVCHERICYCNWRKNSKENTLPVVQRMVQPRVRVQNRVRYEEACMSFPHRSPKKCDRFSIITVRYQIPKALGGFKTIEEKVEGLKAHIFQHETDHSNGKNIYFQN